MDVLIIVVFLLSIANAVASFFLYRKLEALGRHHRRVVGEMTLNSQLAELFSGSMNKESIYTLAHQLFQHAKKRYNLKARSHDELIKELRSKENIKEELREAMIDFFENLMLISYKKEKVSDEEKEELKRKIKLIIAHLHSK